MRFLGLKIKYNDYSILINLIREIFIYECYKAETKEPVKKVVDIGSHIGISILYFKHWFPNCVIDAYEPDSCNRYFLEQNIKLNALDDIVIYPYALSNTHGNGSITYGNGGVSNKVVESRTGEVELKQASKVISLEKSMIKIDVEGMENRLVKDLIDGQVVHPKSTVFIETKKDNKQLGMFFDRIGFQQLETTPAFYVNHPETVYQFQKMNSKSNG